MRSNACKSTYRRSKLSYTPLISRQSFLKTSYLLIFSSLIELAGEDILIPTCPESFFKAKINKLQEELLRTQLRQTQDKAAEWNKIFWAWR
jgi:hypothetical protein